jgi:hypothetical protein
LSGRIIDHRPWAVNGNRAAPGQFAIWVGSATILRFVAGFRWSMRRGADSAVLFAGQLGYHGRTMDISVNFILGVLAILYGLYSFYQRKTAPQDIKKLQIMIERNGEKMANSIHLFGYTILPIVAGLLLLHAHFRG